MLIQLMQIGLEKRQIQVQFMRATAPAAIPLFNCALTIVIQVLLQRLPAEQQQKLLLLGTPTLQMEDQSTFMVRVLHILQLQTYTTQARRVQK